MKEIDDDPDGIDDAPSFVVLMEEADPNTQMQVKSVLTKLADLYRKRAKEKGMTDPEFNFFAGSVRGDLADRWVYCV